MGAIDDAMAEAAAKKSAAQTAAREKAAHEAAQISELKAQNTALVGDFLPRIQKAGIPKQVICYQFRHVEETNWRGKVVRRYTEVTQQWFGWKLARGWPLNAYSTDKGSLYLTEVGEFLYTEGQYDEPFEHGAVHFNRDGSIVKANRRAAAEFSIVVGDDLEHPYIHPKTLATCMGTLLATGYPALTEELPRPTWG